ncbi:MAG: DUF2892 domain-containing protein [Alcaligenaceae bacterium]|jgi:hypothetical protein|nr:DUF2892 domain-containing protein [Alcaligenaceae bacterium]
MNKNIGSTDRWIRIIVGVVLIVLALTDTIGAWGWLGIIPLATALINFCPLYRLIGLSTRK